jgi:hypothetical protein
MGELSERQVPRRDAGSHAAHRGGTTRATETAVTVSTGLVSKPTDLSSNEASAGSSELKRCHWDSLEDVES